MKRLEKWLLLEQSGELSPRRRRKLARELERSADACRLREELAAWSRSIQVPDVEPAPWTITRISARLRSERGPRFPLLHSLGEAGWKPALALAACLLLAVNLWNLNEAPGSSTGERVATLSAEDVWDDSLEEDLAKLETLIVAISGDPLDISEMK